MSAITVTALHVYPIKSCRGLSVDSADVVATGLAHDRRWQVVDGGGKPITQRQHPQLATVQTRLLDGGLAITADGLPTVAFDNPTHATRSALSHLGVPVDVADAGDEAAAWFSKLISAEARLVGLVGNAGWRPPAVLDVFDQPSPFADAAPILLTNRASLEWLETRADETFGMDRFRPNIVVTGAEPWEEDGWRTLRIGDVKLSGVLPWPRCAIPQVNQQSGQRHKQPARVLKRHRWCTTAPDLPEAIRPLIEGNALFGLACSIGPMGSVVQVGDVVDIGQTAAPMLLMDV